MENAIVIREENYAPATVTAKGQNYSLALPNGEDCRLERDKHFGNPKTKDGKPVFPQPILYKGGAEKVIHGYKVLPRFELTHAIRDTENGFFYFEFKCSLVAVNPATGEEIAVAEGFGSSNTNEKKSGFASAYDQANPALKNGKKRAMVDAAINLAGLSVVFTQDLENENFMKGAADLAQEKDEDTISTAQRNRLFALGKVAGLSREQLKTFIAAEGFESTKDIKVKDYDTLCEKLQGKEKEE